MIQKQPTLPKKAASLCDLTSYFWHKELHSKSGVTLIRKKTVLYLVFIFILRSFEEKREDELLIMMNFFFQLLFLTFVTKRLQSKQSLFRHKNARTSVIMGMIRGNSPSPGSINFEQVQQRHLASLLTRVYFSSDKSQNYAFQNVFKAYALRKRKGISCARVY